MSVLTQFPLSVSLSKFDQPVFRIVTVFSTRHQHSDWIEYTFCDSVNNCIS